MSFFEEIFNCCKKASNKTPNSDVIVEDSISGCPSRDIVHGSKMKRKSNQSSLTGITCDSPSKTSIALGSNSTISPNKPKKNVFDCSAIFMHTGSVVNYDAPDYIPKDVVISEEDILKAKEMRLIETEGHLFNNSTLVIDPLGIKNHCQRKDSISYFWLKQNADAKCFKEKDYILSYHNPSFASKFFFIIFYIKELNIYKIRLNPSLVKSLGKLVSFSIPKDFETPLNTNELITIGDMQFHITLKSNGMIEVISLENGKKYIYSSVQAQVITIGKSKECSIAFPENNLLSDVHLAITFCSSKRHWMVKDNSGNNDLTHHCWMLSHYPYTIYNGLVCKIDSFSFKIEMTE